jgi:hypothetical protein
MVEERGSEKGKRASNKSKLRGTLRKFTETSFT